jgi:hypothetical protein
VKTEVGIESGIALLAITLRYILELSHKASTMRRKVIVSLRYRSGLIGIVIASYSYRSNLIGIVIASYSCCSKVTKLLSLLTTTPWISALWDGLNCPCNGMHACERRIGEKW